VSDPTPVRRDPEEELVPEDDVVIGKAFRWSLLVLAVAAAVVVLVVWLARRKTEPPPQVAPNVAPPSVAPEAAEAPLTPFTDVTDASGIRFVHEGGRSGEKLLPETMGCGVAFLDYDGDGDQDLLFANGSRWPSEHVAEADLPTMALYRNDGKGHFTDVTKEAGLAVPFYGFGLAVADYDGDGDPDVLVTGLDGNHLFRNDGGHFTDVTEAAGVADRGDWTTSAGFFDYDGDGDLDLFVCSYVQWSPEIDRAVAYTLSGIGRAYGPPTNFRGAYCHLYRPDGHGKFTDVSEAAGIRVTNPVTKVPVGKSLALGFLDVDGDGRLDVFVANDTTRNFLFRNKGDGTFEEIGEASGVAYDGRGAATGAMGVDVADPRLDGGTAIAVGNFSSEMTSLYVHRPGGAIFSDSSIVEGIGAPSLRALSFGVFFFDYDLDGRPDLFQTNGHIEEDIAKVQPGQQYRQSSQLFWNEGGDGPCYRLVPKEKVGDLYLPVVGRGAAYGDLDGDGDLDVVVTQRADRAKVFRNDQALGHHWLRVRLAGKAPNTDAIGARVELTAAGRTQRRLVTPTRSYLSQVELPVTFGLGTDEKVERLHVVWPGGTEQDVPVDAVDRMIIVRQK
jgi:hypothetical protein